MVDHANLFGGGGERCVVAFSAEMLGALFNIPAGAAITGLHWDAGRRLVLVEVTGAGVGVKPPEAPPELSLQVLNSEIHIVRWDLLLEQQGKPNVGQPAFDMPGQLNMGQRLAQPSLPPSDLTGHQPVSDEQTDKITQLHPPSGDSDVVTPTPTPSFPCEVEPDEQEEGE